MRKQIKAEHWGAPVIPVPQPVTKASAVTGTILQMTSPGQAVWHNRNLQTYQREGYCENTEAHACIRILASIAKGIDYKVYRKEKGDKRTALDSHPLLDLLTHPNPTTTLKGLVEGWIVDICSAGNAFLERVGPDGKPPRELYLQRPFRMYVMAGDPKRPEAGLVTGYKYQDDYIRQGGRPTPWLPDLMTVNGIRQQPVHKILHSKFFNPVNDWYGLSPLEVCARSVDQINAAEEWNAATLQNGGRPTGFLSFKDANYEQTEELEEKYNRKHSGAKNAGRTLVTNGDATYTRISVTPQEMDWLGGQDLATRRICSVFGVAEELIGASQHKTFNNWYEARRATYLEGGLPLVDFMLGAWNEWFQPFFGEDIEIGYERDSIDALQEDRQYVAERALGSFKAGAITRNDYRKEIGLEPLPPETGDVFLVPTTVVPMNLQGKPTQALAIDPPEVGAPARTPRPRTGDGSQPNQTGPQLVPKPARNV